MNFFKKQIKHIFETHPHSLCYSDVKFKKTYLDVFRDVTAYINILQNYQIQNLVVKNNDNYYTLVVYIACVCVGVTFVPISDDTPQPRISKILNNLNSYLFVDSYFNIIDTITISTNTTTSHNNSIYCLFTSGTTGDPKPVFISKTNLYFFLKWFLKEQKFTNKDVIFIQPPITFDGSVIGIYGALSCGASIILFDQKKSKDFEYVLNSLKLNITTLVCTPSFLRMCLLFEEFCSTTLLHLRKIILGGEVLAKDVYMKTRERFNSIEIWNSYGLTETTVAITSILLTDKLVESVDTIPVGYISPYTSVELNNEDGEIIVYGKNNANNLKTIHTGDIGWFSDNLLFFSGRKDAQIKVNGYRVELEDIKQNLNKIKGVSNCDVLFINKQIVAFVVCDNSTYNTLSQTVSSLLPPYMIPRQFIKVNEIKLTNNGKIDKENLKKIFNQLLYEKV